MAQLKLICDEHVGRKSLYPRLKSEVYCQHVQDQPQLGAGTPDREIWKYAARNNLTVFTNDGHFKPGGAANPGNGTWPGVIYYDSDVPASKHQDAVRAIATQMSTKQIATYHKDKHNILFSPGKWA